MGSPITFSGFNNIDFSVVLSAIMQQERAPIAAIETQRTSLQAKDTAFSTFATKLAALETAAENLATGDDLSSVTATSSDESVVGISTGSASATGSYEVVVSELAKSQVLVSSTSYDSLEDVVATSGAISLARFGDPPIDVPLDGSMTLQDIAEAINNSEAAVTAAVVQVTPGEYRLVLTGRATGTANSFTVSFSTPLAGGEGLAFDDPNTQDADDAELTVNQVAITSASNTLDDVIPGVTLQLRKASPTTAVTVDVAKDPEAALEQVNAFAAAYNDVVKFIGDQTKANADGKAAISGDPLVRGLRNALRSTILEAEASGTFTRLADVGIEFDTTGKISINESLFTSALESSPAAVRQLFGGSDGTSGRFGELNDLIGEYTEAGGLVADIRERIDEQVSQLGTRITTLEDQLAIRRAALQQEFIAADRAMSQLQSQGASLAQLTGQFRLF